MRRRRHASWYRRTFPSGERGGVEGRRRTRSGWSRAAHKATPTDTLSNLVQWKVRSKEVRCCRWTLMNTTCHLLQRHRSIGQVAVRGESHESQRIHPVGRLSRHERAGSAHAVLRGCGLACQLRSSPSGGHAFWRQNQDGPSSNGRWRCLHGPTGAALMFFKTYSIAVHNRRSWEHCRLACLVPAAGAC
jgi:hypothetical protein